MDFQCHQDALAELSKLASADRHSVLIDGLSGCGKSWLASQYGKMCAVSDIITVSPTVDAIRDAIDQCYKISNTLLICVENLDQGVPAASHALLKFLEEPKTNIYVVVTCNNIRKIPDTIVSRSACVTVARPTHDDILSYAKQRNSIKLDRLSVRNPALFSLARSFSEINTILAMTDEQVTYFESLPRIFQDTRSVSELVWKLGHYPSNEVTPVQLVIRYLMETLQYDIRDAGIDCLNELSRNRIATHAAVAKFVMGCKYG